MLARTLLSGLYFILASLLLGCTSLVNIETTKPPVMTVPPEQWKVVVVNTFNTKQLPDTEVGKAAVLHLGAQAVFDGVVNAVLDDSTFVLVHADSAYYGSGPTSWNALNREQIKQVYDQHPHHLLVALDNFEALLEQGITHSEEGNKIALFTLHTNTHWTLYDSTGVVLDQVKLANNTQYSSETLIGRLLATDPSRIDLMPALESLAYETGQSYWQRFQPQRNVYSRTVYAPQAFVDGVTLMHQQNWHKAIAALKPFTTHKNKKLAGKAAYNLAVIYEALGQVEEAKKWAAEAAQHKSTFAPYLQLYLENQAQL